MFISPVSRTSSFNLLISFLLVLVMSVAFSGCVLSGGEAGSDDPATAVPALVPVEVGDVSSVATLSPSGLPGGLPTSSPGVSPLVGSTPGVQVTSVPVSSPEPFFEPKVELTLEPVVEPDGPTRAPTSVVVPVPTPSLEDLLSGLLESIEAKAEPASGLFISPAGGVNVARDGSVGTLAGRGNLIPPEAGGLVNPNDEFLPLVYFEGYGVNPFVDADEDPLSTFSLDGDNASFEIAKLYLDEDRLPPEDSVRVEEWVNSFDQGYPNVESGLGLFLDGGPSPYGEDGYRLVRVGVGAASFPEQREPVSLVIVLDTSGSMTGDGRIGVAKRVILGVLDLVQASDRVALVTYGDTVNVLHDFVPGTELGGLTSVMLELEPYGGTFVEGGILKAYQLAASQEGRPARIVVVSDGVGNLGATGPDSILSLVDGNVQRDVVLSTIGVGTSGNYNDVMLEVLANRGNGIYHYILDDESISDFLAGAVRGIFTEVARDARIQVEFNPETVRKYRLIGYENRAVADQDFRDDSLDFGELGFARDVTALYELRLFDELEESAGLLTAYLRWMDVGQGEVVEVSESLLVGDLEDGVGDLPYEFRRTAAVAEFAELLRKSFWAQCGTLDAVGELLGFEGPEDRELDRMILAARNEFEPFCKP